MVDLDRQLHEYGVEIEAALHSVSAGEIFERAEIEDPRSEEYPDSHEPVELPAPRRRWTPLRVTVAAAVAALLLFLPTILLRDDENPPVVDDSVTVTVPVPTTAVPTTLPVPTTAVPTTLPVTPSDPETFSSATSLGTIQWTRSVSDRSIDPVGVVDGQILARELNLESFEIEGWWISPDGVTWTETTAPEVMPSAYIPGSEGILATTSSDGYGTAMGGVSARQVLSRFWQEGTEDPAVIRREDTGWVSVALPNTDLAAPTGTEALGPRFTHPIAQDAENWVVPAETFVRVPWADTYGTAPSEDPEDPMAAGDGKPWPIWQKDTGVLEIFTDGQASLLASLSVELTSKDPVTIEFRDAETGDLVHRVVGGLPGWSPEALYEAFRYWGLDDLSFIVSRDGEVTNVKPPWPMDEEWSEWMGTVAGRYYTVTLPIGDRYEATAVHLWESEDGTEWHAVDLPQLLAGSVNYVELASGNDQLILTVHGMDSVAGSVWVSNDGRNWIQSEIDPSQVGFAESTDFGWMMNPFDATMISADGQVWEGVERPPNSGEPTVVYLNGMFIMGPEDRGGEFVTWVGRFQE